MPKNSDQNNQKLAREIAVIDDEEFYQDIAHWSLGNQHLKVRIYANTDAFFTQCMSVPEIETPDWILVDWFGPDTDVIEEGFPHSCRKLGMRGKIVLWSNLKPNPHQLSGFDGFLSKGLSLNFSHLKSSLFEGP